MPVFSLHPSNVVLKFIQLSRCCSCPGEPDQTRPSLVAQPLAFFWPPMATCQCTPCSFKKPLLEAHQKFRIGSSQNLQGKEKNKKLNFLRPKMAHLEPPFRPQKPPQKSLCGSLFCALSQEMRHINFFSGGPARQKFRIGSSQTCREKNNVYRYQSLPFFLKRPCNGKKWLVPMNLPSFAVEAYVPEGSPESGRIKFKKMPSGRYRYRTLLFQNLVISSLVVCNFYALLRSFVSVAMPAESRRETKV